MKKLIKKILREEIDKSDKHYRMLDIISDHVELPFFKSMEGLTIYDEDDQLYIMKKILGDDISIEGMTIYNGRYRSIYEETSSGLWDKNEYDNGKLLYSVNSNGDWEKNEYDDNGNKIYSENSNGYWEKYVYNDDGNLSYYKYFMEDGVWEEFKYDEDGNSISYGSDDGVWWKKEYDDRGRVIYEEDPNGWIKREYLYNEVVYHEDSDGDIYDNR